MEDIKIRIRWSGGNTLVTVSKSLSLNDLRKIIAEKTSIPARYQELRKGYPPAVLSLPNKVSLQEASINSGETILVERLSTPLIEESDLENMIMFRRIIAADNSCLFNAVAYAAETRNKNSGSFLRGVIAASIESDVHTYNQTLLGRPPEEYCQWINLNSSWGGGIELAILSSFYCIEIAAVSIQDARIDLFGQEHKHDKRIYVIYDGIHYDVLVKNYSENESEASDIVIFDTNDDATYQAAIAVASDLMKKRQFTDVNNFTIMCGVCFKGFVGEKEIMIHAQSTGHGNFQEYRK